jgi:hypothetical protein
MRELTDKELEGVGGGVMRPWMNTITKYIINVQENIALVAQKDAGQGFNFSSVSQQNVANNQIA